MAAPRPPDRQGSADRGRAMESRPEGENGNSGAPGGDRELAQVRAAGSHEVAGWEKWHVGLTKCIRRSSPVSGSR
jgi:hypothetical protein